MISPIVASLLAEMVPTCAISRWSFVGLERLFSSLVTAATALSIPVSSLAYLLSTLCERGYLERSGRSYRSGPAQP